MESNFSEALRDWQKRHNISDEAIQELGVEIKTSAMATPVGFLRRLLKSMGVWSDDE